jgi:membrane protein DedA with SNARE-associated domain
MHAFVPFLVKHSYCGIFALLGLGFLGLPMPDETIMACAGALVAKGILGFPQTMMAAFAGTACGVTIEFLLGRYFGYPFLEKYACKMRINPNHLHKAEAWYGRYGKFALFVGYFIPGIRHMTAIFAGISKMPFRLFATFAFTGGFLWTLTFVSMGYFLGEEWKHVAAFSHRYIVPLIIIAIVIAALIVYLKMKNGKNEAKGCKSEAENESR